MTLQGDKTIRKPLTAVWCEIDSLILRLSGNCFAHGFAIGTVCATAFWTLYLW